MMKKHMQQRIAFVLATLLFISITACSKTGSKGATGSAQSASGPINLTFWDMSWGAADKSEAAIRKFLDKFTENNPNITVQFQIIPWSGYYDIFMTAINSGTAPDVSTGGGAQVGLYAKMGVLNDLQPIVDKWKAENNPVLKDLVPSTTELWRYGGELSALVFGFDPKVIIYRKDYLNQAGVTSEPKTFDEFATALRKIKAAFPDKTPLILAAADSTMNHNATIFLFANGTGLTTADMVPNLQSKAAQESLNFVKLLYDEGLISKGTAGYTNGESDRIFMTDGAAFVMSSSLGSLQTVPFFDQCAILPPLAGPSTSQGFYPVAPNPVFSFSNSKYPDEARALIKFFMESNKDYFIESAHSNYPPRVSYYEDPYWAASPIRIQLLNYAISEGLPQWWPVKEMYPAFLQLSGERIMGRALQQVVMGIAPMRAGVEVDAAIQEALDTYN
jgi:multiple sugar transport system substrate-binding protein